MALSLIAISVLLLALQHTIVSSYVLLSVFYLALIASMLSIGHHALAIATLLSYGAVILVLVLIVRSSSSVSIDTASLIHSVSSDAHIARVSLELQISMILCIMLSALTLIQGSTSNASLFHTLYQHYRWSSPLMLFECRFYDLFRYRSFPSSSYSFVQLYAQ